MHNIVLFDIDGTLLINENYPYNFFKIKDLIVELKQRGYIFGLCTNRPMDKSVKKIICSYELDGPLIMEGGACLYRKKNNRFILSETYINDIFHINKVLKTMLLKLGEKRANICLTKKKLNSDTKIIINDNRKFSATIRYPTKLLYKFDWIFKNLKSRLKKYDFEIEKHLNKLCIYNSKLSKFEAIERYLESMDVVFITDYEREYKRNSNTEYKVYSVGECEDFNILCDRIYEPNGVGIEKLLKELRSEI